MIDLSEAELNRLYEGSKNDRYLIVGSEVRQMVGMIRRSADRIEELEAALRTIAEQRLVYDGDVGGNYELRFNHIVLSARAILTALAPEQDKCTST